MDVKEGIRSGLNQFHFEGYRTFSVIEYAPGAKMFVAKELYQLQEIDLEIEAEEQTLSQKASLLGERQVLDTAQDKLTLEQNRLDELRHQQHSAEWEIDDLTSKIAAADQKLYGGKITNPKELSSLQHEVSTMKAGSDHLENKALEIMDQVETAKKSVVEAGNDFKKLQGEWHRQQQQLSADMEQLKNRISGLKQKRQQLSEEIESQAVNLYEKIRSQKRQPVAKVEQGICRACRISLPASELQRARSGYTVQCGSCGRILFLP